MDCDTAVAGEILCLKIPKVLLGYESIYHKYCGQLYQDNDCFIANITLRDINKKHLKVATFDNSSNNAVGALHQYFRVCQKEPELGDVCAIRVAGPEVYANVHCLVKFWMARAGEEYTVL